MTNGTYSTTFKGYSCYAPLKKLYFKRKNGIEIAKNYISLDTETSHNHDSDNPVCWIYQWCFTFNKSLYYGRTPEQLIDRLSEIAAYYGLSKKRKLYIFVHNLPYDFSYLCLYLERSFGAPKVLASAPHKPFSVEYDNGLCFRCSYKLSNDSLERWGKKYNIRHPKMTGAIDYNIIRYQDTPLGRNDWRYMFTDCIALDECIQAQLRAYNDTTATMPLTSTGYVRREIFRAYNGTGKHNADNPERRAFTNTALDLDSYIICRDEISGGITHGNRFYRGKTVRGNIRHRDFRSHYPTQQHKPFPVGKLVKIFDNCKHKDVEPYAADNMIMIDITLDNIRLKGKHETLPYLQTSHVLRKHGEGARYLDENGRIIALKGQTRLSLEWRELSLLFKQYYVGHYYIHSAYASYLGNLPPFMRNTIDLHYKAKSDLKTALREAEKNGESREKILAKSLDLMKSKNMLNGIYGVTATDPVRQDIILEGDAWKKEALTEEDIATKLDKYYNSKSHCMRYQWGCMTTLLARLQLMEVYYIIGSENFLYADTDSIFYISTVEIEKRLEEYNNACYQWAIDNGAYITTNDGKIITYNSFDDEGENITAFRFLHSKCYAYITDDSKLHCTIAGVPQYDKETKTFREDELGSIDELTDGKIFTKCGGTTSKYIAPGEISDYYGNSTGGGCIISRTTKTLSAEEWDEREEIFMIEE